MADDGSAQSSSVWPLPKFHFQVKWDDAELAFQEVSGLDMEAQVIEYRAGNSPVFSTVKMPGLKKSGNITMKKGVFKGDNALFDWFNEIKMNIIKRKALTISLLDEGHNPTMVWKVANALPAKITGTDLKAEGNEVAVEIDRDRPRGHHRRERLRAGADFAAGRLLTSGSASAARPRKEDGAFQEVSGLEAEMELETVVEGGENRFVHRLPKPVKHPNLVLKRGIASDSSQLVTWCQSTSSRTTSPGAIAPRDIVVCLRDEEGDPLRSWSIGNAFPVKWQRRAASAR